MAALRLGFGAVVLAALWLTACAPLAPGPSAPVDERRDTPGASRTPAAPGGARPVPAPPAPPPVAGDAVTALLADARRAVTAGQHQVAVTLAERAQRLDPRAAEPYRVLAEAHRELGSVALARQLALKGVALSSPGSRVRADLESLLRQLDP